MTVRRSALGVAVATTLACLLSVGSARADVAPPPDYVEQCARWKVEGDDEYCEPRNSSYQDPFGCLEGQTTEPADVESCQEASTYDQADCCHEWIEADWVYRCRTWGGSFYSSMWCRPRQDGDAARPAPPAEAGEDDDSDGGCAVDPGTARGSVGALGALALLGLVAVHRRRRRKS